jgi:HPt (histidine-containing phosphotransfer) domain-containing protein
VAESRVMTGEEAVFDVSMLEALRSLQRPGETDITRDVVQVFLETAPGRLKGVDSALRRKDVPTLERHAHSLKASAAIVGARRLSALCAELEERASDLAFGAGQRPRLEAAFAEARAALLGYLAARG